MTFSCGTCAMRGRVSEDHITTCALALPPRRKPTLPVRWLRSLPDAHWDYIRVHYEMYYPDLDDVLNAADAIRGGATKKQASTLIRNRVTGYWCVGTKTLDNHLYYLYRSAGRELGHREYRQFGEGEIGRLRYYTNYAEPLED